MPQKYSGPCPLRPPIRPEKLVSLKASLKMEGIPNLRGLKLQGPLYLFWLLNTVYMF